MKRKLYTRYHDIDLLKQIDNSGQQFTAEEHAFVMEREFTDIFKSKESLLGWYLSQNSCKLLPLAFLAHHIYTHKFKRIISLGAGHCVLEYLLKEMLPNDCTVVAVDFDDFFIEKAKHLFPQIISVKFDFFKNDIGMLENTLGIHFDLAVFFGSSYVMDDSQFINLFGRLKEIGIRQIIDFYAGYIDWRSALRYPTKDVLLTLKRNSTLRRIFKKSPVDNYAGKFHGFSRSHNELKRLYRKAGIKAVRETSIMPYKYIAVCDCI